MKFVFMKSEFKGTYVPDAVFDGLYDARNNDLKVILYVIKNEETDPLKISSDLNISHSAAVSSLMYWADKGLIHCEEETVKPKKKKVKHLQKYDYIIEDFGKMQEQTDFNDALIRRLIKSITN